jgi:DNA-binding Xre family transcriptional regulator
MPIISNLTEIMIDKKMTYEELQYRSKVAPDTVARARDERIASCKLLTLEKLAQALDVHICQLFQYEPEKKSEQD